MRLASMRFEQITRECRSARNCRDSGLPPFDEQLLQQHRPDAHWQLIDDDRGAARCSLWWSNTPRDFNQQIGLIGHYAAADDTAAAAMLDFACDQLSGRNCALAVGPMDGNTWRDYRFITESGSEPSFYLEPQCDPAWPRQFARHGFQELAAYFSALATDLTRRDRRTARARRWMEKRQIDIRPMNKAEFVNDLRQIHGVAQVAFREHLFYRPLDADEFLQQYEPLYDAIPFDLILLAENRGEVVGFGFALPDLLQAERSQQIETVVIKTLGVLPQRRFAGLGRVLLEELQHRSASLGFRRAIHALVRETGDLQRISRCYAEPFRRYALFAKELPQ